MDAIEFIQQKKTSIGSVCSKHEAIKKAESLLNGAAITTKPATKPQPEPERTN